MNQQGISYLLESKKLLINVKKTFLNEHVME